MIFEQITLSAPQTLSTPALIAFVLFDIFLIVGLARLIGNLMARIGQPRVVGEILAGILLGPTLLGTQVSHLLAPPPVYPALSVVATIGLMLFMFLAGIEYDSSKLKGRGGQATILGLLAVGLPVLLGFPVAWVMQGSDFSGPNGNALLPLGLFLGAALSVTAFPVMAHILMERGELNSPLGSLSVACAGLISFFMFIYIAFASSVAQKQGLDIFMIKLVLIAVFSLASVFFVRPVLRLWLSKLIKDDILTGNALALIFGGLALWALLAHLLGIHALIGSFIWGFLLPEEPWLKHGVTQRIRDLALILFLPVFFALAGFSTDLKLLRPELLPALLLFLGAAVISKFISALPARLMGLGWGDVLKMGALFNMRGLLVLAVGLIGLDLQIITPAAFTVIVVTALVTNLITMPVFRLVERR